jgi:hypothetical protein
MDVSARKPRVFPPVGRCIYCGSDGSGTLTKEHILPAGLGGSLILPRASCSQCQKVIHKFETICMRQTLLPFRKAVGLTRHPDDLPASVPLVFDLDLQGPRLVALDEHPNIVVLPGLCEPPGILAGRVPKRALRFEYKSFAGVEILAGTQQRLLEQKRVGISLDGYAWVRMLAKIAHGIAVAELGPDGFDPKLPDLILGRNPLLAGYLVGQGMVPIPLPENHPLHQVSILNATMGEQEIAVVHLRLFADLGIETPTYTVVVGSLRRRRSASDSHLDDEATTSGPPHGTGTPLTSPETRWTENVVHLGPDTVPPIEAASEPTVPDRLTVT